MDQKWYAVYTKLNCELSVSKALSRRKIINYCPAQKIKLLENLVKKYSEEPVFKSYVFVKISDHQIYKLKKIAGVINLLYYMHKPVVINDIEINSIKYFIDDHINIRIQKIIPTITKATNSINDFIEEYENKILIPSLCCNMIGELATDLVKQKSHKYLIDLSRLKFHYALK